MRRWITEWILRWHWRRILSRLRAKHDYYLFVAGYFGANTVVVNIRLMPRGHPKRTAQIRVLVHGLRDYFRKTSSDWDAWQEAIK